MYCTTYKRLCNAVIPTNIVTRSHNLRFHTFITNKLFSLITRYYLACDRQRTTDFNKAIFVRKTAWNLILYIVISFPLPVSSYLSHSPFKWGSSKTSVHCRNSTSHAEPGDIGWTHLRAGPDAGPPFLEVPATDGPGRSDNYHHHPLYWGGPPSEHSK